MNEFYLCLSCSRETFPFFDCDYDSLIAETFDSNYDCKCKEKPHLEHNNPEKSYGILLNLNELNYDDNLNKHSEFDPKVGITSFNNFRYYSTHEFHKLIRNLNVNQCFSLMHTNISSLTGNFDKLEHLITYLDFCFDIIACTETWNPEDKKHLFTPGILERYHKYEGVTGSSMKGGCGMYIKESVSYIP